jgi:hypothetical protein
VDHGGAMRTSQTGLVRTTSGLTALVLTMVLSPAAHAVEGGIGTGLGLRHDRLRWNIASDPSGSATPNILSELTWSGLDIVEVRVEGEITTRTGLHVRGALGYGVLVDGRNQDSDYNGDDRTLEFSRSNNDTDNGDTREALFAIGYRYRWPTGRAGLSQLLTPLLGYAHHEQNLRITNGNQTIPATGPFAGLDSTYQSRWRGPWAGLEYAVEEPGDLLSFLRAEYHVADYYGMANWNLRTDLQHSKSFEHVADGEGRVLSFGILSQRKGDWNYRVSFDYRRWRIEPGTHRAFFASGAIVETRLNDVQWRSYGVHAGLRRSF